MARKYRYETWADWRDQQHGQKPPTMEMVRQAFEAGREMAPPETFEEWKDDANAFFHEPLTDAEQTVADRAWDAAYAAGARHALKTASEVRVKLEID